MAILKAHNSFLKANGKILGTKDGGDYVEFLGVKHEIVQIGNLIWTAQNLFVKPLNLGTYYKGNDDYGPNGIYKDLKLGVYFNKNEVIQINNNFNFGDGWRIATLSDWNELKNFVGDSPATKLKVTLDSSHDNGWTTPGTDEFGFHAISCANQHSGSWSNLNHSWGALYDGSQSASGYGYRQEISNNSNIPRNATLIRTRSPIRLCKNL